MTYVGIWSKMTFSGSYAHGAEEKYEKWWKMNDFCYVLFLPGVSLDLSRTIFKPKEYAGVCLSTTFSAW